MCVSKIASYASYDFEKIINTNYWGFYVSRELLIRIATSKDFLQEISPIELFVF